jgi:predicted nucleotidyltransferase
MDALNRREFCPKDRARALRGVRAALSEMDGLRWAYVFGSAARGEAFHDLDVAVCTMDGHAQSLLEIAGVSRRLADASGLDGLEVDVLDVATCALPLLGELLRDGEVVLDREPAARRRWEGAVTLRWLDFEPFWREQARLARLVRLERKAGR